MVSSLPKCFRPRRNRSHNKKKQHIDIDVGATVDIASSSTESEKEVTISPAKEEMPPGGTAVQEVMLERQDESALDGDGPAKPVVVETSEVVDSCGCPVNLKAVKDAVSDLPPEYKEAARTSSLVFASLAGLFFSIVFYRYLRHLYSPQPEGFFCYTFAWLFAPLFDALCEIRPPGGFIHEMTHESSLLFGELQDAFMHFFRSIFDGFHAMGVIFSKMAEGLAGSVGYGLHELFENVSENIAFLFRFCGQFVHSILHIFIDTLYKCGHAVSSAFTDNF